MVSPSTTTPRVWHISGANTGFGLELALKAVQEGDQVIAAVRSPSKVPDSLKRQNVKILQYDMSWSQDELNAYAEKAFAAFGKVDVLINNAAYSYLGAIEETEDTFVKQQFDVNVFVVLRTIRSFLPYLRRQHSGLIMNMSSIGGIHGFATNGIYCATKYAIEGLTESLAAEVAPFGIQAVIVEPGYFRTEFLKNPSANNVAFMAPPLSVYDGTPAHEARDAIYRYNGHQLGNPKEGAARIWEFAAGDGLFKGKERLLRLPLGSDTGAMLRSLSAELARTADYYDDVSKSTDFKD